MPVTPAPQKNSSSLLTEPHILYRRGCGTSGGHVTGIVYHVRSAFLNLPTVRCYSGPSDNDPFRVRSIYNPRRVCGSLLPPANLVFSLMSLLLAVRRETPSWDPCPVPVALLNQPNAAEMVTCRWQALLISKSEPSAPASSGAARNMWTC